MKRLAGIFELLAVFGVGLLVLGIAAPWAGEDPVARGAAAWLANLVMLGAIWVGLRARGQGFQHLGLAWPHTGWRAVGRDILLSVAVLLAALAAFVAGAILMGLILGVPERADLRGYESLRGNPLRLVLVLAAVYLASALGEEVTYRGFLVTRIAELGSGDRRAWRLGVLSSAVVFGLAHYTWGPAGIVQTAFMGLALGACYLALGRRLWVLVLAHVYMDTLLLLQIYFAPAP